MESDSGKTVSVWMATTPPDKANLPLQGEESADVCVIGAGIAGLTTAYLLTLAGRSVIVLDDGPVAGGETCRTTAHLTTALDDRYYELERLHGEEGARLAHASHAAAIDQIEKNIATENIDCGFARLDGYLFVPPGESLEQLDRELDAAKRAGCDVEKISRAPVSDFDTGPAVKFSRQAQFHPLRYLASIARSIESRGGRIFTGTHANEIVGGSQAHVWTSSGATVRCQHIVVATNTPVNDRATIHTKQAPYRTYVIGARVPKGMVTKALFWDTADPYHYVRLEEMDDHDVLIVGGEDHKTGQADDQEQRFANLAAWTRARWPMAGEIEFRWSGQVMEPVDGMAYIGRNPMDKPNVFIATGDSGNGMTHGTIAGMLITDLIQGRPNAWETLYDPSRKRLRAAGEFLKENLNVAAQYGDLVTPGEVDSVDDIAPGAGAVLRRGLHKIAVYRDDAGQLHERSASCPHMGCIVGWNKFEKSWDCPCHGSRFDARGRVINGPAIGDLHDSVHSPPDKGQQPQKTS
jgi:glycine/D-amino acid oxidase-like deaminating enzyme/nitrite reductase/ring-hydroxylating ferredoxin subunit